jgi:hypothetical protein
MPDDDRKYTPEEMDAILGRAMTRADADANKVDHETLVAAAAEVGIPRGAVDAAAREVRHPPASRRRAVLFGASAALVGVVGAGAVVFFSRPAFVPVQSGTYVLQSTANGRCMDGPGFTKVGWTKADEALTDSPCETGGHLRWVLRGSDAAAGGDGAFAVESEQGKKCLDVPRWSGEEGLLLQQYPCTGQPNQRWRPTHAPSMPNGVATLVSAATGKCATVGKEPGGQLHQATCVGSPAQLWRFQRQ